MFNYEETITFKKMHGFSMADGSVGITEDLSDVIKYVGNEPSAGLFYIQQHTHNSAATLLSLETNVLRKSHETSLHKEDLEDCVTMVGSMKECGFPIVDGMIKEIEESLSVILTKKPKRGLITPSPRVGFLGDAGSWSPATWGKNSFYMSRDIDGRSGYLSNIFGTPNSFKADQVEEGKELSRIEGEVISTDLDPMVKESCLRITDAVEGEYFPVGEESRVVKSLSNRRLILLHEEGNYDEFMANQEAKLEEWIGGTRNEP